MFKKKKQAPEPVAVKINYIELSQSEFLDYTVEFQTGKLTWLKMLVYFAYILENDLHLNPKLNYCYPYLIELLDYGLFTEDGLVNIQRYHEYVEECYNESIGKFEIKK